MKELFHPKRLRKYILLILFLIFLFSCVKRHESDQIKFSDLEPLLDSYIANNDEFERLISVDTTEKYPIPSIHLYVYLINNDTVVSIVQNPFLTELHILGKQLPDSSIFYSDVTPSGLLVFKKTPVVFFDPDSLLKESSLTGIGEVTDEFKFQGQNIHRKLKIWDFTLKNGNFVREDRKTHLIESDPN